MAKHTFKKGLNLPISGKPLQQVEIAAPLTTVAIVADDYVGMRPRMLVSEGDSVKRGQKLFEDRKTPGVFYTAPGAGIVEGINRGARRALLSVVVKLNQAELDGTVGEADLAAFAAYPEARTGAGEAARALLIESGLWTAFRTRPYGRVPAPDSSPRSIFVTAMDTQPLAASVDIAMSALDEGTADFQGGIDVFTRLTEGNVFVCKAQGSNVSASGDRVRVEEFAGPHPAGTAGLHIHTLDPVGREKSVWYVGYQDVVAIGRLFKTGRLCADRVVSLAGPSAVKPRLLKTRLGANLNELVEGEVKDGKNRVVSGSVLSGRNTELEAQAYLGRYHNQVTVLAEAGERVLLGWAAPGFDRFSIIPGFISRFLGKKSFDFNTDTRGGHRAMVPIGMYEQVMPMDILPTFLLRALAAEDLERAEELGCLELEEEDLALCTFACPSKNDHGKMLREALTQIEKES